MRTLILDDELSIVTLLARVCEQEGHAVREFTKPRDALACLEVEPIDLLVTDLVMPETNGLEVIERAWRFRPELYVLMVTGHAGALPVETVLGCGRADIMFKPFRLNEFTLRLQLAARRCRYLAQLAEETRVLHATGHKHIERLERELRKS